MSGDSFSDAAAVVQRWQAAGGIARVLQDGPPLVIALLTCDGGLQIQRVVCDDPALRALLIP